LERSAARTDHARRLRAHRGLLPCARVLGRIMHHRGEKIRPVDRGVIVVVNGVQNGQAVQMVQNVLHDWNTLSELNGFAVRSIARDRKGLLPGRSHNAQYA
jgi:hypothetical protein